MDTTTKKRKVTIKDVLDEHELELLGIRGSVDGSPVNSLRKMFEFLEDSGMYESTGYKEIQDKYKGKLKDKELRAKYHLEIASFIKQYYSKNLDEHFASL